MLFCESHGSPDIATNILQNFGASTSYCISKVFFITTMLILLIVSWNISHLKEILPLPELKISVVKTLTPQVRWNPWRLTDLMVVSHSCPRSVHPILIVLFISLKTWHWHTQAGLSLVFCANIGQEELVFIDQENVCTWIDAPVTFMSFWLSFSQSLIYDIVCEVVEVARMDNHYRYCTYRIRDIYFLWKPELILSCWNTKWYYIESRNFTCFYFMHKSKFLDNTSYC